MIYYPKYLILLDPPMPEIMDAAQEQARKFHTGFEVISDPDGMEKAFKEADVVYAKSWGAMLTTDDANEGAKIIEKYKHWITDTKKMKLAKDDAIYMQPVAVLRRYVKVVERDQNGQPLLQAQLPDQVKDRHLAADVQVGGRFVKQQ
jgi:ornithine carbamoyltransferase